MRSSHTFNDSKQPGTNVSQVVERNKDMLKNILESSKKNMQYHIADAISAKYKEPL